MIWRSLVWAIVVALVVLFVLTTSVEAKKKNRKHDGLGATTQGSGKKRDKSRKETISADEGHEPLPASAHVSDAMTTTAMKDIPVANPAVAPDVDNPSAKRQSKHRNREGRRHRLEESEGGEDVVKEKKDKKKDKSERKKHHKKHNREGTMTTTATMEEEEEINAPANVNDEAVTHGAVGTEPLVELHVDLDDELQTTTTTMMMMTTTVATKRDKKHSRDREGKRLRDEGDGEQTGRKKAHKNKDRGEKKKQKKHNSEAGEEAEMTVNPTPSPAADGVKLTPSGPSPMYTTQQQSPQAKPENGKKRKKQKMKDLVTDDETDLSKTEKRIQRLERKMERMGHGRKNATKIPCEDHRDCKHGQCCLLKRGKRVCHVVNKPEGHHCVHNCMCNEGLTCVSKNRKQKSLSKGHCRREDITEMAGEGDVTIENQPITVVDNELPQ